MLGRCTWLSCAIVCKKKSLEVHRPPYVYCLDHIAVKAARLALWQSVYIVRTLLSVLLGEIAGVWVMPRMLVT